MKKIIDLLNECKCSGDDKPCKCKKGSKCDGKCSCKVVKEAEDKSNGNSRFCPKCGEMKGNEDRLCPDCELKRVSGKKTVKEDQDLEEGKFDNDDDYGDYKHELKKDKELERQNDEKIAKKSKTTKACACGCKDGIDGKCAECGKTLKESKFAKYLEESNINENIEVGLFLGDKFKDLQAEVVKELKKGFPSSIPRTILIDRIAQAEKEGKTSLQQKLEKLLNMAPGK
jgi:hypothetical protein